MENTFLEVNFASTRAQAIGDGVLIDLTKIAKEEGLNYHIVVSRKAWNCINDNEIVGREQINSAAKDVCVLAVLAFKFIEPNEIETQYPVKISANKMINLKAIRVTGNDIDSTMIILMPDEDVLSILSPLKQ
ncbi:hypothetical protein MZM54_00285 [[Brevibacterium] frigoritolerans]|nr:hypothetical protein [Peribacillus frigoritolerans]